MSERILLDQLTVCTYHKTRTIQEVAAYTGARARMPPGAG